MQHNRIASIARILAITALSGVVVVVGSACKRAAAAPVSAPTPPPTPKTPVKSPEQAADENWLRLRKTIKNIDGRVDDALKKLEEAAQLKTEKWDGKPDDPARKAALKEIQRLKADAGDIWDMLREDADKLSKDLWSKAFGVEVRRWDAASKKLKGLPRLGS